MTAQDDVRYSAQRWLYYNETSVVCSRRCARRWLVDQPCAPYCEKMALLAQLHEAKLRRSLPFPDLAMLKLEVEIEVGTPVGKNPFLVNPNKKAP